MLTFDLVRTRKSKDEIIPRYVDPEKKSLLEKSERLIELYTQHVGRSRGELEESIKDLIGDGRDFMTQRGLSKLLADRSDFGVESPVSPAELRAQIFALSAQHHPVLHTPNLHQQITRTDVLTQVAEQFELSIEQVEAALYADLQDAYILNAFEEISAEGLLHRYNLALAQAVLFRATKMRIWLEQPSAKRLKQLLRYIRFFKLIAAVEYQEENVLVTLDGPLSLFKSSQKYGLQMAQFLPALLLCETWSLRADLLWGDQRQRCFFQLSSSASLVSHYPDKGVYLTEEEQHLRKRWKQLKLEWELKPASRLLRMGSKDLSAIDYRLVHSDGRECWLEMLGFWNRESLHKRLALLEEYGPEHLIVAFSSKMRVSQEDIEVSPPQVYIYKDVLHPKRLVEKAEILARPT